jgi:hypothetical protein
MDTLLVGVALATAGTAMAQTAATDGAALDWRPPAARLGLDPAKAQFNIGCGASLLPCREGAAASLASSALPDTLRWSVEVDTLGSTSLASRAVPANRQGLNLSLVGRKPLFGSSFSVYGKLGTTYAVGDPALAAATGTSPAEAGYGLSYGAGLSMNVTPRLSASFGFDSHELRLGSTGPRDPVRSTSLGLQYRY